MTDTGSKSFDCALVSTLTYDDPENGNYVDLLITTFIHIITYYIYNWYYVFHSYYAHFVLFLSLDWLESVGSRVIYVLDYKKPIMYVIPNFPFRVSWGRGGGWHGQASCGSRRYYPASHFQAPTATAESAAQTCVLTMDSDADVVRQLVGTGMTSEPKINVRFLHTRIHPVQSS